MEIRTTLQPGRTYHICTRSNGNDRLFRDHDDFIYFRSSFHQRLHELWEIIAWTLLPNEVHIIMRVRQTELAELTNHSNLLGHMLNGYVQHYNRKYFRQGSLLNRSFRRQEIKSKSQLKDCICQIDNLAMARNITEDQWPYCSCHEYQSTNYTSKAGRSIVKMFTSVVEYIVHHTREGMMKLNMLPPRKWIRDWCKYYGPLRDKPGHPE